jgi:hypothetical protein
VPATSAGFTPLVAAAKRAPGGSSEDDATGTGVVLAGAASLAFAASAFG